MTTPHRCFCWCIGVTDLKRGRYCRQCEWSVLQNNGCLPGAHSEKFGAGHGDFWRLKTQFNFARRIILFAVMMSSAFQLNGIKRYRN